MTFKIWILYSSIALISIISPGPAILLAISNSIAIGPKKGLLASLGNVLGLLVLSTVSIIGLGTIIKTSSFFFGILKFCGAIYLIFLGIKQIYIKNNVFSNLKNKSQSTPKNWQIFSQGFFLAVTNPKSILFFMALFPQFMLSSIDLLPQFAILTGTFMIYSFISLTSYALLANLIVAKLDQKRSIWFFNKISGVVFILLGIGFFSIKV